MSSVNEGAAPGSALRRPTTPVPARRSASKVEFLPSPTAKDRWAAPPPGAPEPRHEWDPECQPVASSLLVRLSLTPESTTAAVPHATDGSGTSVAVALDRAHPSAPAGANALPSLVTNGEVTGEPFGVAVSRRRSLRGDSLGSGGASSQQPISIATGKRPSFVEGSGGAPPGIAGAPVGVYTIIGTEREEVHVDKTERVEETLSHAEADDDAQEEDEKDSAPASRRKSGDTASPHERRRSPKRRSTTDTATGRAAGRKRSTLKPPATRTRSSMSPPSARRPSPRSRSRSSSSSPSPPAKGRKPSTSPSPSRKQRAASTATGSGGGKRASKGNSRPASSIGAATEKALKGINYAAFSNRTMKPKLRRAKMVAEFLAAHQRGAAEIAAECEANADTLFDAFVKESFVPHQRELLKLAEYVQMLRKDCKEKLTFAASTCNSVLDGVESLLERLHEAGLELSSTTHVLSVLDSQSGGRAAVAADAIAAAAGSPLARAADTPAPLPAPAWKQPVAPLPEHDAEGNILARGHVMAEARDAAAAWRDVEPHPRSVLIPHGEMNRAAAISAFFKEPVERLRQEAIQFSLPPNVTDVGPRNREHLARLQREGAARQAQRASEALALKQKMAELTTATVGLMQRLQAQDARQRSEIAGLQRALDEQCTRQKVADDVLHGCLAQGAEEAAFNFARMKDFEMQLRVRMDAIEGDVRAALEELLSQSASLGEERHLFAGLSTAEAGAAPSYHKENCLKVFTTRMERNAREQAAVLRDAQDTMQRLWQSASPHLRGREEKRTLLHHGLSTVHEAVLQGCDRDTLVRLLHHLSLQDNDTARRLTSALQEHEKFLSANTAEAVALKEHEARRVAVTKLLGKMYEESCLHNRPHQLVLSNGSITSGESAEGAVSHGSAAADASASTRHKTPLSVIVMNMAQRYNDLMTFEERHARGLVRQREELEAELSLKRRPSFFNKQVPVPTSQSPRQLLSPVGTTSKPAGAVSSLAKPSPETLGSLSAMTQTQHRGVPADGASSLSAADPFAIGRAVAYLQTSNPSLLARAGGGPGARTGTFGSSSTSSINRSAAGARAAAMGSTVSVVGDGRWGGRQAARPSALTGTSPRGAPAAAALGTARDYASLSTSASAARTAAPPPPPPPPGLPLRTRLVSHVVESYSSSMPDRRAVPAVAAAAEGTIAADGDVQSVRDGAAGGAAAPLPPPRAKRAFDNSDLPFLQKQRQVLEPLLGRRPTGPPPGEREAEERLTPQLAATV